MGASVESIGWACDLLVCEGWLSAPPLVGCRSGKAAGGLREPVEFSGWGPGSQREDPGWPSAREGTEGRVPEGLPQIG